MSENLLILEGVRAAGWLAGQSRRIGLATPARYDQEVDGFIVKLNSEIILSSSSKLNQLIEKEWQRKAPDGVLLHHPDADQVARLLQLADAQISGVRDMAPANDPLPPLLKDIRACRICEAYLPLGPRPVLVADRRAPILIAGQAPGTRVHASGIPWDDKSGDRLREWLDVDKEIFYDPARFAIIPQGFCYPGKLEKGGDAPPRPECAETWHPKLIPMLSNIRLIIAAGQYAHKYYLGRRRKKTLTETVASWRSYEADHILPLPHPSWRVTGWLRKNPWFEAEVLPHLRARVKSLLTEAA